MKPPTPFFIAGVLILSWISLPAQETPQFPQPVQEHQFLNQFVGKWESESEILAGPDQPAVKGTGSAAARMLGGFWVILEVTGKMEGMTVTAVQTIGYDTEKKKYVGAWVDSMINYMWRYEGWLDESGKILTLEAEGPNFMTDGKMTKFRDAYEFKSEDHVVLTSSMLTEGGEWVTFMTGHMRRTK